VVNAAIIGLGWWGKTLVESVQGTSGDIRFAAAVTRTRSEEARAFADQHGMRVLDSLDAAITDGEIDAVVLATPHSLHTSQVIATAAAGKHVFCEKPFALTKADAEAAVEAVSRAGVALGVGYNRRFHPEMASLRDSIRAGDMGVVLHFESTMTFPNALSLRPDQWRANPEETPCGGLTPMGVHAVDAMIDLCGPVDTVFCQSFRRVVEIPCDDTTSILFRMRDGASGYLGTLTATGPGFSLQLFGSKGWVRLEGMTHVAGASSEERRTRLFKSRISQPVGGQAEVCDAESYDVTRAALEAFAHAAAEGADYPIPVEQIVHGAAVTEAIARSAKSGQVEQVA
jgi:predicted dehydrogenase